MTKLRQGECVVRHDADQLAPAGFRWRGRSYRVLDVLACWNEAGSWWSRLGAGAGGASAAAGAGGVQPLERQVWRVVADGRYPPAASGVYDLVHEPSSRRWWLARVWD